MPDGGSFCHKCGAPVPPGSSFCAKCGAAVTSSASSIPASQPRAREEKGEKHEKQEKHEKGEKSGGGGMLGAIVAGLILIWLGTTFYLEQNGYLASDIWWAYFISGVGIVLVLDGVVIYTRGHVGLGPLIGGAILLFGGLSSITTNNYRYESQLWPLAIIVIGAIVLITGVTFRKRVPKP